MGVRRGLWKGILLRVLVFQTPALREESHTSKGEQPESCSKSDVCSNRGSIRSGDKHIERHIVHQKM